MKSVKYSEFKKRIEKEQKDRIFKLKQNGTPPTFLIPVTSKKNKKLQFFDEDDNYPKNIRYSSNQKSCIEEDQKGSLVLSPIEFSDGLLRVPKEYITLQIFILIHPDYGTKFVELDKAKDAAQELEEMDLADKAYDRARELEGQELFDIATIVIGESAIDKLSTFELKRDIRIFAKNNPSEFLNIVSSPTVDISVQARKFFKEGLLSFRNNNKEVYYNLKDKKTRLLRIPEDTDPYDVVSDFLCSDKGLNDLKMLEAAYDAKIE